MAVLMDGLLGLLRISDWSLKREKAAGQVKRVERQRLNSRWVV
jgi:hypothetical protein